MKIFEYYLTTQSDFHDKDNSLPLIENEKLNRLGEEGWELVTVVSKSNIFNFFTSKNNLFIFKREKVN